MPVNQAPHIHQNIICANVFIKKADKYLLMKRSSDKKFAPNYIHPFGGKLNTDENPYQGAIREIKEETNLCLKNIKLEAVVLEILPDTKITKCNWLIFHFSANYQSGQLKVNEEGEAVWLSASQILSLDTKLFPSVRNLAKHILNPNDGVIFATFKYNPNSKPGQAKILKKYNQIDICAL